MEEEKISAHKVGLQQHQNICRKLFNVLFCYRHQIALNKKVKVRINAIFTFFWPYSQTYLSMLKRNLNMHMTMFHFTLRIPICYVGRPSCISSDAGPVNLLLN